MLRRLPIPAALVASLLVAGVVRAQPTEGPPVEDPPVEEPPAEAPPAEEPPGEPPPGEAPPTEEPSAEEPPAEAPPAEAPADEVPTEDDPVDDEGDDQGDDEGDEGADEDEVDEAFEGDEEDFEDDGIELQPEELAELQDEWDISAFGNAREVKRVAGSAHRIDKETLERFEDDNIHNTLRRVPGVYVRGEDGYGLRPNIGLRGATSDRSKKITLMEDGVLFGPAPYSAPAAYYFPLATRMNAIEVFKGASALRHGPHTIGGAINMVTRPIPWGHAFGADLALGSEAYGKGHAHYGYGTDHWGVLVEGVRLRSDGFKRIDANNGGDAGFDKLETMLKARLNTDPGAENYNEAQIKLGYARETSNETYLGLTDDDFAAASLRRYAASQQDRMEWDRFQVELTHAAAVGDWLRVRTTAYRHDFQRSWLRFDGFEGGDVDTSEVLRDPTSTRAFYRAVLAGEEDSTPGDDIILVNNDRTFVAQGLQSSAAITLPKLWRIDQKLKVGARFHHDSIARNQPRQRWQMRSGNLEPVLQPDGSVAIESTTVNDASSIAVAGYVVDEIALWRFLVTPGIRVEYVTSEFENVEGRRVENQQGAILPGIGLLFQAAESISLLAGVHQGYSPVPPGQSVDAEPETATNYEFGSRLDTALVGGEVIGFVSDYQNLTDICGASSGCQPTDVDGQFDAGDALIWGVEASLKTEIPTPVDLTIPATAAYTFTKATYQDRFIEPGSGVEVDGGVDIVGIPAHQIAGTAGLASKRWGSIVLGGTFVDNVREVPGVGEPGPQDETDSYVVFDLAATLRVMDELSIYGKVENLLDNRFILSRRPFGARPGRPRFAYGGVKVTLD